MKNLLQMHVYSVCVGGRQGGVCGCDGVCVGVWVRGMSIHICVFVNVGVQFSTELMWKSEGSHRYQLLFPTLFETGSLIVSHQVPQLLVCELSMILPSLTRHFDITGACHFISSTCVLGIQIPVVMFIQQVCYSLSHLLKSERFLN